MDNSIKYWAEDDKPREKLLSKGRKALSNAELIAILIGSGYKDKSAVDVAKEILKSVDNNFNQLSKLALTDLMKVKGIGEAKAVTIIAAIEIGARRVSETVDKKLKITSSKPVFDYFNHLSDLSTEEFWVLLLSRSNEVIGSEQISSGGVSGTVVDPKVVFKKALDKFASGIILVHNHPSGNLKPSGADLKITEKIKEAGNLLEINVLDHIIVANRNYFSFADEGIL